jgi:transcriptional antiterminator RfaH
VASALLMAVELRIRRWQNVKMSLFENKAWYVVYSKPQKEEFAQFHLRSKGVEVFFPRLLLPPPLGRRKQIVALFPNYLFVRFRIPEEYECVTWSPGIKRFVSFNDVPVPIDEDIISYLMRQANPAGVITARSNLKVGQEIRINGGAFDGLAGVIQGPPDGRGRVRVLMELLSRRIKVEVPLQFVSSGGVAYLPVVAAERLSDRQNG